jgi:RNA polymerase sigma-70 factor (ECF subfamily)
VTQERGRFRTFRLACCQDFLANERERRNALERGGGLAMLSLTMEEAEVRCRVEPTDRLSPEALDERRWAILAVDRAREELARE